MAGRLYLVKVSSTSIDCLGRTADEQGTLADISTKGDLLDRLHRHLTVVFSLRSFPKGHLGEELKDENDNKRGADELFFLPSCEDGKAYIRCYFEHAGYILSANRAKTDVCFF